MDPGAIVVALTLYSLKLPMVTLALTARPGQRLPTAVTLAWTGLISALCADAELLDPSNQPESAAKAAVPPPAATTMPVTMAAERLVILLMGMFLQERSM